MQPKLFLHIGTHKTASTVIQNALAENRGALRQDGLLYPATHRGAHPHLPKHDGLFQALLDPNADAFETEYAAFMNEYDASRCRDMLISEEALSEPRFEVFEKLRRFEAHFSLQVICYLRRPDFFLESLWNQRCKEGYCKSPVGPFSRGPFNRQRVMYPDILDWWSGFAQVTALNYENAAGGRILETFSEALGYGFVQTAAPKLNVSPSAECALLMSACNLQNIPFDRKKLIAAFAEDRNKYALGSRLRQALLDDLEEMLHRLERDYGVRFDMEMPQEPQVPLTRLSPQICAKALGHLM